MDDRRGCRQGSPGASCPPCTPCCVSRTRWCCACHRRLAYRFNTRGTRSAGDLLVGGARATHFLRGDRGAGEPHPTATRAPQASAVHSFSLESVSCCVLACSTSVRCSWGGCSTVSQLMPTATLPHLRHYLASELTRRHHRSRVVRTSRRTPTAAAASSSSTLTSATPPSATMTPSAPPPRVFIVSDIHTDFDEVGPASRCRHCHRLGRRPHPPRA